MAAEPLLRALTMVRQHLLDPDLLVRAVASGRRKGETAAWKRVELRWVDLKAGRRLQVVKYDETQAHTSNHAADGDLREVVDALLEQPFAHWHVETTTEQVQLRVTKKLEAMVHVTARAAAVEIDRDHDRDKQRLLATDDPVLVAVGISTAEGRIKPSRQAKYRQVEEFLRLLDASVTEAITKKHLRSPTAAEPLRIVDLGCGNAYLTFAAQRYLTHVRKLPVRLIGVDVKQQSADHNSRVATDLGIDADFVVGSIADVALDPAPDVVLALHACDTATDEALARAVEWDASLVLAAPCCHHDIAAQLRTSPAPSPYAALTRHGILRERFADTLTDALRASLMRLEGYRVDVVEFVESAHTPRNTLLRATRTSGKVKSGGAREEYDSLVDTWQIAPRLAQLLGPPPSLAQTRARSAGEDEELAPQG